MRRNGDERLNDKPQLSRFLSEDKDATESWLPYPGKVFVTNSSGIRTRLPSFSFRAANDLHIVKVDTIVLLYRCLHLFDSLLGCDVDKPQRSSWIPIRWIIIITLPSLMVSSPRACGSVDCNSERKIREPGSNDRWVCYIQLSVRVLVKGMNSNISPR